MFMNRLTRVLLVLLALGIQAVHAVQSEAVEQLFHGPWQVPRTGALTQVQAIIEVPATLMAPYRLHVQNGDGTGAHRVLSATIALNGTVVVFPREFYDVVLQPPKVGVEPVLTVDRTVPLEARNTLAVRFLGAPGSYLVLSVYGTVPPPTLRSLEPPTVSITEGATGTLTATISTAQASDTAVTLTSSDPTVASVPASAAVPAGQVAVPVPVAAGVPGTATITASLNGSSGQSTIAVTAAGPTLTSLLPATLQVAQGAAGTLTVTISAAQLADTVVPLSTSDPGVVAVPATVIIPAGTVAARVTVTAVAPGTATVSAGPLTGTSVHSQVTVVVPAPTVVRLAPPVLPLAEGSTGTLAVTLNASQPMDTEVALATSDEAIVGLPGDRVIVPAHTLTASFPITGLARGTATVTVALNGVSATSAVTVQPPLPTLTAFSCPAMLTAGATGQCTATLNATQITETIVPLSGDAPAVLTVPASVTVPAGQVAAMASVTGLTPGVATITAGPLSDTTTQATVQILPPLPTVVSLAPSPATLLVGASATLTLTLNAAQATDTVVTITAAPTGVLTVPSTVTVPAGGLTVLVPITGVLPGTANVSAGPLNGSTVEVSVTVNQLPPTVTALTPPSLTLPKGTAESLSVAITPVQSEPATVPLASSDPSTVEVPASVPVPAGSAEATFPIIARNVGQATVTAGPLNGTTAEATVTVTPPALVTLAIGPATVTLAVGQTQTFTATGTYTDGTMQDLAAIGAWTSSDETIATVSNPGGVVTARAVGQTTIAVTADGKTATATVNVSPPALTVLALAPSLPIRGVGQTVQFHATGTYTDATTQDLTATVTWSSSDIGVASISSNSGLATAVAAGQSTITAMHADGLSVSTTLTVTAPVVVNLAISPQNPTKTIGRTLQFTATGTYSDRSKQSLTTAVSWTSSPPTVATITPSSGLATALAEGTTTITATHPSGVMASTTLIATPLPPDPGTVAPPVSTTVTTALAPATEFLYMGPDPVQTGMASGTIDARRAAVLRGRVLTRDGNPLSGVTVSILNHPEYGTTLSRADGIFDLAVNGGGQFAVVYQKTGYLPAQRPIATTWQDYAWLPDVALIPYDARVTTIDLAAPAPIQVARGNPVTDSDGTRQATLFFRQGTTATVRLPDGSTQPLTTLSVRATEYTVGPNGPTAMPAPLPATTAYTYCAALTVDEAVTAGATTVQFNNPVVTYVENFIGFPVGGIVPLGYYDRQRAAWVPSDNGRVIKILSITGGLADLDISGAGTPANASALAALGVTDAERQQLATLYTPGQSLWRMPVAHFTDWDANWGWGPPLGAEFWTGVVASSDEAPVCRSTRTGSVIGCQNQTLGEVLPLVGTPFTLHYASDRFSGRTTARTLEIPVTGANVSTGLKRAELEIFVAGQRHTGTLPAQPNQIYTFAWDGRDVYGRILYGGYPVVVRVGYVYDGEYMQPAALYRAFGYNGGGRIVGARLRQEVTLWQEVRTILGTVGDARAHGLGGWTLDVHHRYDPGGQVLHLGDGTQRRASDVGTAITTVTTGASWAATFDAQGTLYYASGHQIKKRTPAGVVSVVAGTVNGGFGGDGGLAINAQLNSPYGMSIDAHGNLYFADYGNHRIRKVSSDGIITTVAGNGLCCEGSSGGGGSFTGDGGPATQAGLELPWGVTVDGQGNLLIADTGNSRVRKVTPDGIIRTIAGGGNPYFLYCGDGGPATAACLRWPGKVAIDQQGNLFIPDHVNNRIRKVTPEGIISTVAGTGPSGIGAGGYAGDGGPATAAQLNGPLAVTVDAQGNLYIPEYYNNRVRLVNPQGLITTIAGTGTAGFSGDGGPATSAKLNAPREAFLDPQGVLHIADAANGRIRKVVPVLPGVTTQDVTIPSADGAELYVFSSGGRHLRTHHSLTRAIRYTFGYNADDRLVTITDGDNNVTLIDRDVAGQPTAIVAPDGQRTTFTVDANGFLGSVTNPAGEGYRFTSTADGLLQTMSTPRNQTYRFTFDALGRLTRDEDPAGGVTTLDRTGTGKTYTVTLGTALNRTSTFHVEPLATGGTRQVDTEADGTQTDIRRGSDGVQATTTADGTLTTLIPGPDPRFGMQAAFPSALTVRMPSGLTSSLAMTRTVTLSNPTNPLSLTSQTDTMTRNGRVTTSTYAASTKTITDRSAANRVVTTTLDVQGRVVRQQLDALEPVEITYDPRGRLSSVSHGTGGAARASSFTYNSEGFLETVTDPLSRTVRFTYDPAGRVLTQTLPDLRVIQTTYDANGNVASITPPSRPAHTFGYTPVDLEEAYVPPDVGIGNVATSYLYNQDRQLTQVTRPDGQTLTLEYEPTTGRLNTLTTPTGQTTFTYHPTSGNVSGIASPGGVAMSYTYDGSLLTGTTWTGPVAGSVTRTYDTDFRVANESINGGNSITLQYDPDSLLTQAGSLTLTRHPQHGLLTGTAVGNVADTVTYSTFGEVATYQASYNSSPLLNINYTRDTLGRIIQKVETIGGVTTTTVYGYDQSGRLTDVTQDGTLTARYEYDGNGNRLSVTGSASGMVAGTYDAQDRLTSYGAVTYTYTANGEVQTATSGGETTTYSYDVFGNLIAVGLPDGTAVEYVIDGQHRRVGKKVNGVLTQGFLYSSQLRPAAELDGSGAVVSRFVYGTKINVPDYMVKNGATYRLLTDHLGSVRLVVDAATGTIAQRLDYDEFGQITQDTHPGFQPFGFAGGLYDPATKLVRFGVRDYDAFTGRWTTKDPIGFLAGDPNMYRYLASSPVSFVDPAGNFLVTAGVGALGGMAVGAAVGAVTAGLAGGDMGQVATAALAGALSGGFTGALVGLGVPLPVAAGLGGLASQAVSESVNGTLGTDTAALRMGLSAAIGVGVGTLGSQILPGAGLPGRILVSGTTGMNKTAANRILSDVDSLKEQLGVRTKSINSAIKCP